MTERERRPAAETVRVTAPILAQRTTMARTRGAT